MSFREKLAWAAFVTTLVAWGGYLAVVVIKIGNGTSDGVTLLWLFIAAIVAQIVLLGATAIVAAVQAPADARAQRDERDRTVGRQASAIAYFVVLLGIAGVIVGLHVGLHGHLTIFALLGVFVLGEATRFGSQAIGYRRSA